MIFLLAFAARSAAAQAPRFGGVSRTDSVRILRAAKSAQIRFESRRRFLAPQIGVGSRGRCQVIGRFCRYASGMAFTEIPLEPPGISRARNDLLQVLASASLKLPGDGWIIGQRVRYLLEAGNDTSAGEAVRSCQAERWWCDALAGLASHASNHFAVAEQWFARSLREMPLEKRCEWTDLSELLDGDALPAYRKLACEGRGAANRRIWWLADPLFSTPGNERRTEHFARHTWAEIDRGGANGFGMSWAKDMMELIVRFGWAEKWTQQPPSGISDGATSYASHEREPTFHFLSSFPYDAPIGAIGDSAWNLNEENPREGYSPHYASTFVSLQPQLARFRRGDSTLIVAAFDVTGDTTWKYPGVRPALVVAPSDTTRFLLALLDSTPRRSALWITTPSRESLASVELISLDGKVAGRWRGAVRPLANDSAGRAISDLLLFDATDSLATGIEGAIAEAYGGNVIPRDRKLGLYWEIYGVLAGADDSAQAMSLTLTPIAPNLFTRVLRSLGVAKKLAPIDVRWRDAGPDSEIQSRSVLFDLSQVARGSYTISLGIGESGQKSAVRILQIR